MAEFDIRADIIDVRDLIARIEFLRQERAEAEAEALAGHAGWGFGHEEREELAALEAAIEELRGNGGDHEWDGSWFPIVLVRDSYWLEFVKDEADQLDLIKRDEVWPYNHIDWDAAAEEFQMDYSEYDLDGSTYWAR